MDWLSTHFREREQVCWISRCQAYSYDILTSVCTWWLRIYGSHGTQKIRLHKVNRQSANISTISSINDDEDDDDKGDGELTRTGRLFPVTKSDCSPASTRGFISLLGTGGGNLICLRLRFASCVGRNRVGKCAQLESRTCAASHWKLSQRCDGLRRCWCWHENEMFAVGIFVITFVIQYVFGCVNRKWDDLRRNEVVIAQSCTWSV